MGTKAQLRQRVLEDLGIVQIGQTAQSQDDTRVEAAYQEEYAKLKELSLAVWSVSGDIPSKIMPDVIALTAWNCIQSGSYGVSPDRYARIQLSATQAPREIRRMVIPKNESLNEPRDF